jgi:excisionase family DNA binding protein
MDRRSFQENLTIKQAADMAKCCTKTIRRLIKAGKIQHIKMHGKLFVLRTEIEQWIRGDIDTSKYRSRKNNRTEIL